METRTLGGILLAGLLAGPAAAAAEFDRALAETGAGYFALHCAACHGVDARGEGPVGPALVAHPADLTTIAARRGGRFPESEIARTIDGRLPITAHGMREMPVWGLVLAEDIGDPELADEVVRGKIAALVEYLKSIQGPASGATDTRAIMSEVFEALRRVLPASLDEQRFADPARQPEIRAALATLSRYAGQLAKHGASADQGFAFLSRSLARDAREIERRYTRGDLAEARFTLHQLTRDCAACHSRLPDERDAALSQRFLDRSELAELPLPEQARLAMATRQFERALAAHEAMLKSRDYDPVSLERLGHLNDYLEVCIRVKRDLQRPAEALAAFADRGDVRRPLRTSVLQWVSDLRQLARGAPVESLADARELVAEAEESTASGGEDAALVRYLVASGALLRLVATLPQRGPLAAEAYYWLGVIESRIGHSFWISQTEPYLEASIRLAPDGPLAEPAFALLEEFVVSGYTGSAGANVPPDVTEWLQELAGLIEASRADPTGEPARTPGDDPA